MAIIFGSDAGVRQNSFGQVLDYFNQQYQATKNGLISAFTSLQGSVPPGQQKEKVFVDSGFTHIQGTTFVGSDNSSLERAQTRNIASQQPMLTVYIKKRAFRALRNENDLKFLDGGEVLFLRATKILFENKCQQLAAYEALTKANILLNEEVDLDYNRIGTVIQYLQDHLTNTQTLALKQVDALTRALGVGSGYSATQSAVDAVTKLLVQTRSDNQYWSSMLIGLQELQDKSSNLKNATRTNWVVDVNQPDVFLTGRGSGVIELTLVSDLNTSLSIDGSIGSIDFTIQDPYNLTKITTDEVEMALSAAKLELNTPLENMVGPQAFLDEAQKLDQQLSNLRKNRIANAFGLGANSGNDVLGGTDNTQIVFAIEPTSSASNKVTASVGDGTPFNKNSFPIAMLQLPLDQQPTSQENDLINQIFDLLQGYTEELQT